MSYLRIMRRRRIATNGRVAEGGEMTMKRSLIHTTRAIGFGVLLLGTSLGPLMRAQETLPDYLKIELKRLEETWNVLDQFAGNVWPGWKSYRDVPFLFEYTNGVRMLVGHPSPTDEFVLVPGIEVQGKKVHLDRKNEIPLAMKPPITGGGGPINIGKEMPVQTVWLRMRPISDKPVEKTEAGKDEKKDKETGPKIPPGASESQILLNIHELFHVFQRQVYQYRFGNLQYNTDGNYALYSEIEGLALEKAYTEQDESAAKEALKDFLAARRMKRMSMTELEQNQESEDDLMEGTAVYSTTMTLELMKKGYKPLIGKADDPFFFGFSDVRPYIEKELEALKSGRSDSMEAKMKCYQYGCFQALLLTRFFPGWQEGFFQSKTFLDRKLQDKLGLSDGDVAAGAERLKTRYPLAELKTKHDTVIKNRDEALRTIMDRKGRVYVVNFKPTGEYLAPKSKEKPFRVGLIYIFLDGIEAIDIRDVHFTGSRTPTIQDQLYYVKWVDTDNKPMGPDGKGYVLAFNKKEGEDIYDDAEFKTAGFSLKAPKIRVQDSKARVKVTVLSKLKGS
jgi:hypothetical protein